MPNIGGSWLTNGPNIENREPKMSGAIIGSCISKNTPINANTGANSVVGKSKNLVEGGFDAQLGGTSKTIGENYYTGNFGLSAYYWTSSSRDGNTAWARQFYSNNGVPNYRTVLAREKYAHVRCKKDN